MNTLGIKKPFGKIVWQAIMLGGLALASQSVWAQSCIQDQWKAHGNKQKLTCTANDVRIARATNIRDLAGDALSSCTNGVPFSFIGDFEVFLGAQQRFDIGLYFATDGDENGTGDGAKTGICSADIITPLMGSPQTGSANFVQLDGGGDICGDINASKNPQIVSVVVEDVMCLDSDGDGFLNLPNCTSWRQDGANETCVGPQDAYPGSPSKCNCDADFNIPVRVELGTIEVTKNASPLSLPEPGGEFTFAVDVQNSSQFTNIDINRICDSNHGLVADSTGSGCPAGALQDASSTTCALPVTLSPDDGAPGGTDEYSCSFTATILSNIPVANEQNTVTVYGIDQSPNQNMVQASDTASVAITDLPPMAMVTKKFEAINCVNAEYSVEVSNTSTAEQLSLTVLNDSEFGDITQMQGGVTFTTCTVPRDIVAGDTYSCTFDADFCGAEHSNKVTATVSDDEGNEIMPASDVVTVKVLGTQQ